MAINLQRNQNVENRWLKFLLKDFYWHSFFIKNVFECGVNEISLKSNQIQFRYQFLMIIKICAFKFSYGKKLTKLKLNRNKLIKYESLYQMLRELSKSIHNKFVILLQTLFLIRNQQ